MKNGCSLLMQNAISIAHTITTEKSRQVPQKRERENSKKKKSIRRIIQSHNALDQFAYKLTKIENKSRHPTSLEKTNKRKQTNLKQKRHQYDELMIFISFLYIK